VNRNTNDIKPIVEEPQDLASVLKGALAQRRGVLQNENNNNNNSDSEDWSSEEDNDSGTDNSFSS
jgi:hypothetical protein